VDETVIILCGQRQRNNYGKELTFMNSIFQLKSEKNIGIVTFDVTGDAMNTWTDEAFSSFFRLLDELEKTNTLKGLILISGKHDNFFAGANLKNLAQLSSPEEVLQTLELFHGAFNRLEKLPMPTLSAIHGFCLGGGLELALACTARIAKEGKTTMIGLPECNVGLLPGGGGTQRLPRLIGPAAAELIVKGTMLSSPKALEMGIIDRLIPADGDLLAAAKEFLNEIIAGKANLKRPEQDFSQIDELIEAAKKTALKMARGRALPGPMLALKSIQDGVKVPLLEGLEIEKKNFTQAILSNEAKGSINTFFIKGMTDKPKAMMTEGFVPKPLRKIGVLGFGTMGRGIIIDIITNMRVPVLVKDVPEALEPGRAFVRKVLDGMAEKGRLKAPVDEFMSLITVTADYSWFSDVDLVIEAVFEDLKIKEKVYGELCKAVKDSCIIASNTSSIPIAQMTEYVTYPARFGGLHFFSPVWLMQLVEVIRGELTSRGTVNNLLNFAASINKRPIVCRDNPGFVVNAMLFPMLWEAFRCLEEGNAIEKIDEAMLAFGMPVGPIRLTDEIGIDIPYKIFNGMGIRQNTLANIVESGRLGLKKSGKGFFLKDGNVDPEILPLIAKAEKNDLKNTEQIQEVILESMAKAGKDLLDKRIIDDVRMIDVGMIWGVGFPADKGGPMKWADLIGMSKRLFGKNLY